VSKCQSYEEKKFRAATLDLIESANVIIEEYARQDFNLTVRQLYYQLVARDIIPNSMKDYKRLVNTIANARNAGLVAWDAIEDRTRHMRGNQHWSSPQAIVRAAINSYRIDMWENQPYAPEVWIEKDSLVDVISGVCRELDVPYFSCRGYASVSSMWRAGHYRMRKYLESDRTPVIFHLGDHDPSGIDMTRDIGDRLEVYAQSDVLVDRLALNMNQVEQYQPPPNPAKLTDTRAGDYIQMYGVSSWELDALDPATLSSIILQAVDQLVDEDAWETSETKQEEGREWLRNSIGDSI
jgi:hypothetical protein